MPLMVCNILYLFVVCSPCDIFKIRRMHLLLNYCRLLGLSVSEFFRVHNIHVLVLVIILHNSISITAVTTRSLQVDSILHAMHDAGIKISLFEVHNDDITSPLSLIVNMSERHLPIILLCRTDVIVDTLVKVILDNATR